MTNEKTLNRMEDKKTLLLETIVIYGTHNEKRGLGELDTYRTYSGQEGQGDTG